MTHRSFKPIWLALGLLAALASPAAAAPSAPTGVASASPEESYRQRVLPVLEKYCWDCHGDGMDKGDLALDKFESLEKHFSNHHLWLAVWKNLESNLMPPEKKPQPSEAEKQEIIRWIERAVFKVDPANPDPGRVTIRRLNREEYRNTVYDLFGVRFDTTEAFPADDTGYGFDTIGDVLNLSPLLMEKYLDAAQEIVNEILKNAGGRIPVVKVEGDRLRNPADDAKNGRWMPFANEATVQLTRTNQYPGRYRIAVDLSVRGSEEATTHTARLRLLLNGQEIETRQLGWDNRRSIDISKETEVGKGPITLALHLEPDNPPAEGENQLSLVVNDLEVTGPLDGSRLEFPKEYYQVFLDGPPPKSATARAQYTRKILRYLADRAFRRPVDDKTLERLVSLAENAARQPGMTFEKGIGHALTAVLTSPRFLFRAEIQPEPNNPGRIVNVDEFSLASRLSYFLWSSLPDDELFKLAREGKLRANLRAQVDRMLKDPRSDRFIRNFVGQWLQTRDVTTINVNASRILGIRNDETSRYFGSRVRQAMRDETDMMFGYILRENRSALEFITADYTFLNESLANFYKIPEVRGSEMRKVSLKPEYHRGGVLTHASFLVVTSNPTRTSPVKRGLFVLENILGTPAPPAPPNVPTLEETRQNLGRGYTMRELMVVHREKPLCASCHARMDDIGLGLENFNALGMWRDEEYGKPIDTAGKLITGEKFNNVAELSRVLATSRKMDYYRCLTEKLLTYAIGRGPEYYDSPTIDRLAHQLDRDGGKLRNLVYGIVESAPFQKRRGDGERFTATAPEEGKKK
ncbi:MAG: DUF1592 domain-containing protein [Verrucomicrobiota bacterium]